MTRQLGGMYAALMSGFADDGSFSPDRQRCINAYVARQGLAGLYVGGSSGESGLMETEELLAQQQVVAEDAAGSDMTLIAHVGAPALSNSIRLAKSAERLGYHALSALPPHAYPFSDEEIVAYYRALAAATALPLIVYEVPVRTGRPIPLQVLGEILDLPGVAGIKFTSTDLFKLAQLKSRFPDRLVFFGFDEIYLSGAVVGVEGGIGTTYNLLGRLYVDIDTAVREGDLGRAQAGQAISAWFVDALLKVGVLPGMKAAFRALGHNVGPTRAPFSDRTADAERYMNEVLNDPAIKKWLL